MIKFFKKIKEKVNFLKYQFCSFKNLKLGDIVWAKMPLSRKNMKKIEFEHRVRPYLIVKKSKFYIYVFQSSSKNWNKAYNYQEYRINRFRYKINKDSFISLRRIYKIPFWNIKSKYISLQEIDLNNIQKRLTILNCKHKYNIEFKIDDGDVIKIGTQLYYVYTSDNVNLYCLIVYQTKPSNQYEQIKINRKCFYTKLEKRAIFKRKEKMQIKNIAYGEEVDLIFKQIKDYKRKKRKKA